MRLGLTVASRVLPPNVAPPPATIFRPATTVVTSARTDASVLIANPPTAVIGDTLVLFIAGGFDSTGTFTDPAGWTSVIAPINSGSGCSLRVYTMTNPKVGGTFTINKASFSANLAILLVAAIGARTIDTSQVGFSPAQTTHNSPRVTPSRMAQLLEVFSLNDSTPRATPAGTTKVGEIDKSATFPVQVVGLTEVVPANVMTQIRTINTASTVFSSQVTLALY